MRSISAKLEKHNKSIGTRAVIAADTYAAALSQGLEAKETHRRLPRRRSRASPSRWTWWRSPDKNPVVGDLKMTSAVFAPGLFAGRHVLITGGERPRFCHRDRARQSRRARDAGLAQCPKC